MSEENARSPGRSGSPQPAHGAVDAAADPELLDLLTEQLYPELRRLARRQRRRLRPGETLDTTSLIHEAYLKLAGRAELKDRAHFLAVSATAMRHILINAAQEKLAAKRGGGRPATSLDEGALALGGARSEDLLAVGQALDGLSRFDPRLAAVVECRFFAGLTEAETAEALRSSERTVRRDWQRARAWLRRELSP